MENIVLVIAIIILIPLVILLIGLLLFCAYFLFYPIWTPIYFIYLYFKSGRTAAAKKDMKTQFSLSLFSIINCFVLSFAIVIGTYIPVSGYGVTELIHFELPQGSFQDFLSSSWAGTDSDSIILIVIFSLLFLLFNHLYGGLFIFNDNIYNKEKDPSISFCLNRIVINYLSFNESTDKDHRLKRETLFNPFRAHHVMRVFLAIVTGGIADFFIGKFFAIPGLLILVISYILLLEWYDIGETPSATEILDQ
jgi:hypothetical protein